METRLSVDSKTVAFRLTCKTPLGEDIAVAKTLGLKVVTDDFLIKDLLKRTGKAQTMKFFATGWVQESVGAEVEAKSAEEALKFAVKNRNGLQDVDWDYDSWESGVNAIQIMDNDRVEFPLTDDVP
ncbi:Uncharacterised protein [uncultured archaeon]|nr:Uncharacterised protein [uncultured archaeon]